ncbi:MAG: class I SAM-dependent methyltransferase [Sulfitobacter sp.]
MTPLSSRVLFWRPRYQRRSAFLSHIPFLFWVIETLRPTAFVEYGLPDGVAFFTACQAIEKLDIATRTLGVGHWTSDKARQIEDHLQEYNAEEYGAQSTIKAGGLNIITRAFSNHSVDLLHINTNLDEDTIKTLQTVLAKRMTAKGVVLFHSTNTHLKHGAARAWLTKLRAEFPYFETDDGDGLCMILWGDTPNPRLLQLASLDANSPSLAQIRQVFHRLGSAATFEWASKVEAKKAVNSAKSVDAVTAELADEKSKTAARDEKLSNLNDAYDARHSKLALVQAENHDLRMKVMQQTHAAETAAQEYQALTVQLTAAESQVNIAEAKYQATAKTLEKTRVKYGKTQTALTVAGQKHQNLTGKIDQLQDDLQDRFDELGVLTKTLEDKQTQIAALKGEQEKAAQQDIALTAALSEVSALTDQIHDLQVEMAAQTADHTTQISDIAETLATRDRELQALNTQTAAAKTALDTMTAKSRQQSAELTRMQAEAVQHADLLAAATQKHEAEAAAQRVLMMDLDAAHTHASNLQVTLEAITNSTSWKVTAPARRLLTGRRSKL